MTDQEKIEAAADEKQCHICNQITTSRWELLIGPHLGDTAPICETCIEAKSNVRMVKCGDQLVPLEH